MHGKATASVPRACRGTATRGRSEEATPWRPAAVSGTANTATAATAEAPSSRRLIHHSALGNVRICLGQTTVE
jgi:hypothetical protein